MTAKKQSLLDKGVIIHVSWLLFSVTSIEWTIFLGFWQDGGTRRLNTTRVQRLINTPKEHIFIGGGHTVTNTLWCSEFLSLSLMHIRVVGTVCADLIHAVSRVLELSVRLTVFTYFGLWPALRSHPFFPQALFYTVWRQIFYLVSVLQRSVFF